MGLVAAALIAGNAQVASAAYQPPDPTDVSNLTWTQGFDALVDVMSREYAFTTWKKIDWKSLSKQYRPRIVAAEAAGDQVRYWLTLREFTHELHDGHVSVYPPTPEFEAQVRRARAGGGFGLIVTRLPDKSVAATWVGRHGPAWRAGIRRGAKITEWQGRPVAAALRRTSTALGPAQPTAWRVTHERTRWLVRAPIRAERAVTFGNPGAAQRTVRLTARDDGEKTLRMTDSSSVLSRGIPKDMVTSRMLPGNVGYVRVKAEIDLPEQYPGDHTPTLKQFRAAIRDFQRKQVKGLVVDIRSNAGGMDQMVADMLSSFYTKRSFYEYQNYIVPSTGRFQIWKIDERTGAYVRRNAGIWIRPGRNPYTGPVAVLVNNGCISSGEGIAMGLGRLPNATLYGFSGTNGSFGMVGAGILLPEGVQIGWPYGQSLDHSRTVQIDSRDLRGGVAVDVTVPSTVRNVNRSLRGEDVVLRYALRELK